MAVENQKFSFLAPNKADFQKKMCVFVVSFVLVILLFIGSVAVELGDSSVVSAFKATSPALFGGLIGWAYVTWQSFNNRQLLAKLGHIEIDDKVVRIVAGQGEPFVTEFRAIEKLEERNSYLLIFYRAHGSLKNKPILLVDVERADEFLVTINERVAIAK